MAEKKFQNFGARKNPQKCSQCRQPGHNKGSSRCPINIKNAATAALAKERQNKFSEDQIRENNNNFGKASNSYNLSIKKISPIKNPILPNDFCSTSSDCSKITNSDARFGTTFRAATVRDQFPLDLPQMDIEFAGLPLKDLLSSHSNLQELDSDGEDFVAGLEQITGGKEEMDIAVVVTKEGEYIEASIADDEWMQDRQDLVTYQGRGAQAAGRGSGRGVSLSGRGRGRGQRSEALITFPPRKVCASSCDCASECWIQEPGKAPHPVRIPTSVGEFLSSGPLADDITSRRKRVRDSPNSSGSSLHEILGAEEFKGDTSFPSPSRISSSDLLVPTSASSEPSHVFPALEALR